MRTTARLPAAALVLLLHAGALLLLWSGVRPLPPRSGDHSVELRLIAPRAEPSRVPAELAPAAMPLPVLPAIAVELPPLADSSPAAPPPVLPTETVGGAAVAAAVIAASPPSLGSTAVAPQAEPPRPARRAACAAAAHPPLLRERGIEGLVRLRVWVDELGRAGEVLVAASSGFRLFDEAAVAQARRCPYEAARRDGREVASWVEFPIRFALNQTGGLQDAPP